MKLLQKIINFFNPGLFDVYLQPQTMKKTFFIIALIAAFSFFSSGAFAQCSICAKTVMQMGDKPAQGFNNGIIYLMIVPYLAIGVVAYKWWQNEKRKS
jgi:hypothetical protein